jgi:hypothetical protein
LWIPHAPSGRTGQAPIVLGRGAQRPADRVRPGPSAPRVAWRGLLPPAAASRGRVDQGQAASQAERAAVLTARALDAVGRGPVRVPGRALESGLLKIGTQVADRAVQALPPSGHSGAMRAAERLRAGHHDRSLRERKALRDRKAPGGSVRAAMTHGPRAGVARDGSPSQTLPGNPNLAAVIDQSPNQGPSPDPGRVGFRSPANPAVLVQSATGRGPEQRGRGEGTPAASAARSGERSPQPTCETQTVDTHG